jgi:hypothetical protein
MIPYSNEKIYSIGDKMKIVIFLKDLSWQKGEIPAD